MEQRDIQSVYFIGAGGIGMSALARYYMNRGMVVAGYDRTPTALTLQLESEGMLLHYKESVDDIPYACKNPETCLVVYTPAIPHTHRELVYFRESGFQVEKRAQVLGRITQDGLALCVAGTHGKTTTSSMCAHMMHLSRTDCNAFLGGISKNYNTNYILSAHSPYVVVEADEFDKSFHWLSPYISVVTSADADHLDIYGSKEAYLESFSHYTSLIRAEGALILHKDASFPLRLQEGVRLFHYSRHEGDFHAENINMEDGHISFDLVSPIENVPNVELGQPIPINIDNAIAAMAMAQLCGLSPNALRYGMKTFQGVERRFDIKINTPQTVLISDYAHHPKEIFESITSIRQMYPTRRLTAIFQPHLYSRTRDFYSDFASSLSLLDEVLLCEIYPARELPIPGVSSRLIYDLIEPRVAKSMINSSDVPAVVAERDFDVLIVLGAGDLDRYMEQIVETIKHRVPSP